MKASLQLRLSQQLALTPQLQQALRLLQLSSLDMQQEVARQLEENPMLELSEDNASPLPEPSSKEAEESRDFEQEAGEWNNPSYQDDDEDFPEQAAATGSLREHLYDQLHLSQIDAHDGQIIGMLIEALDENGYLEQDLDELHTLLPEELSISRDDLETALIQLQHLDRPGLGARNLSECLALQLKALPKDTPQRDLAIRLVTHHLELVAAHDFAKIKRLLRCSEDELRIAQHLIAELNPKPGAEFNPSVADYVTPDVIVEKHKGKWQVHLNPEAMPKLRVNQVYANILQQRDEKNVSQLSGQLQEAKWLIKNLKQRFETILRVAQAIVERQEKFLEHGEIGMRPLVLREIAEVLELHESTVSRSTTQKFMMTPRGIYEFKYFFGSGLTTESGGSCSSTAIRELIKQLVSEEDTRKPLTDSRMSEILAQQGIVVARRTIAKYREGLHILPANLRKSL